MARYGDGFHAPELIAAIAPAVRSLLGDTLIIMHEAQQLDAAKELIAGLRDRPHAHRGPDLCLLVTGPRRRGFGFLDEPGTEIVHDLSIAEATRGAPSAVPGQTAGASALQPQPRARPATRLARFLNAKAKASQSGLAISLEPDPEAGGSHLKGRLLGPAAAIPLLRPGSHFLRHTSSFSAGTGLYLLWLERDLKENEWYLVNAIAGAQLPLDRRQPAAGVHDTPLHVQPARGTYDLYAIASTAGFDGRLRAIADAVADGPEEGKVGDPMLDDLSEALIEIMETDRDGAFATARFTYRVEP